LTKYLLLFSLILFSVNASAEIYKWTDNQGKIHFGDRPISDTGAHEVKVNTNVVSNGSSYSSDEANREELKSIDQIQLERKLAKHANETKKRAACNADKEFIEKVSGTDLINGKVHYYYFEENGKAVSESRKKEMIAELKERLEKKRC